MSKEPSSLEEQRKALEAAIAAQESQRSVLGDAVVDVTISALRSQLDTLLLQSGKVSPPAFEESLIARLHSHIPEALAEKMRSIGKIEEERRHVTVLFADIVGFTSLCESCDEEEVAILAGEMLKEMAEAVYLYEGYVDKFLGDAVMAVFGAPLAHEDDPERALRAALEMRERISILDRTWGQRIGRPLELHIGVNSGEVIAGYSDFRMSYSILGDTVNTASRLADAAPPGRIFVSGHTLRHTREAFSFLAIDPIRVKGKAQPVTVYELVQAKLSHRKTRGLTDLAPSFVGRHDEMVQLEAIGTGLKKGRGQIVMISGEGGIGKSRLAREWHNGITRERQVNWVEGRCLPFTAAAAFGPFLDLMRRLAGIDEDQTEETARHRLDLTVERFFPGDLEAKAVFAHFLAFDLHPEEMKLLSMLPSKDLRERVFTLVEAVFRNLSSQGPAVLVIEDMHWADVTSMELIVHLFPMVRELPLVIVMVCRPEAEGFHPPSVARDGYADSFVDMPLSPLSEESSIEMVKQLLSAPDFPDVFRNLFVGKAEGNPFYVEEMIRALIEEGALVQSSGGRWEEGKSIENVTVPDTLHGLLMARLDRLPPETKKIAQQASVIGRIFLRRLLEKMADETANIDDALVRMEREDLIRERTCDPELEYMFRHALTQEVAYESLLSVRRREIHLKVGEAMESLFSHRIAEFVALIGGHFLKGEGWEKASDYLIRAGDGEDRLYAHMEARMHYGSALDALAQLPENMDRLRIRVDTAIKFARVSLFGVLPEEILERLEEAEKQAESLSILEDNSDADRLRLAQVWFRIGQVHYQANRMKDAIGRYKQVLSMAPELDDPELLGIPSYAIGNVLVFQGHMGKARKLLSQAIPALEKTANRFDWARAVSMRSFSMAHMGDCRSAKAEAELSLEAAWKLKSPVVITSSNLMLSGTYLYDDPTGDSLERALKATQEALDAAEKAGIKIMIYMSYGVRAWNFAMAGRFEEASQPMRECLELAEMMGGQLFWIDMFTARSSEIAFGLGKVEEALRVAEQAIGISQKTAGIWPEAHARRVKGMALTAHAPSKFAEAEEEMAKSIGLFETGQNVMGIAHTHIAWGKICIHQGKSDTAREHWEKAAAVFESKGLVKRLEQVRTLMAGKSESRALLL